MIHQSAELARSEEVILKAAQRARQMRISMLVLIWTTVLYLFLLVGACLIVDLSFPGGHAIGDSLQSAALLVVSRLGVLGLPIVVGCVWMVVEMARANALCSRLNILFITGLSEIQQGLSYANIGPLLDVVSVGVNIHIFEAPTALLGDLLKSVPAGDAPLTQTQRCLLHELVIKRRWDWVGLHAGPGIGETERNALRPAAIHGLAALGNASSIPVLERFAKTTDNPDLRQSALLSAAQIRERLQYGPAEMLRASEAPERPDTLLRPVSPDGPHSHDPQQLLRADPAEIAPLERAYQGRWDET